MHGISPSRLCGVVLMQRCFLLVRSEQDQEVNRHIIAEASTRDNPQTARAGQSPLHFLWDLASLHEMQLPDLSQSRFDYTSCKVVQFLIKICCQINSFVM